MASRFSVASIVLKFYDVRMANFVTSQRKKNRVLLLCCPEQLPKIATPRAYVPLGNAYIAAVLLENGYETQIFDPVVEDWERFKQMDEKWYRVGVSDEEIAGIITRFSPDVVGISTIFTGDGPQAHSLAALVKNLSRDITVVVGGYYPFSMPERALKDTNIDYIIMGEGEYVMVELLDYLNQRDHRLEFPQNVFHTQNVSQVKPGLFPVIKNISQIPIPARHLLPMQKYFRFMKEKENYKPLRYPATSILATRGCPLACTFCSRTSQLGNDYEKRQVDNIRKEIEHLIENYQVRELTFVDDNLILSKNFADELTKMLCDYDLSWYMFAGTWVNSLTRELIDQMKASGLYRLRFNMESANPDTLKEMKKPVKIEKTLEMIQYAKSLGILTQGQFIIGYPNETFESIERSVRWIEEADFDYTTFGIATPYPGTTLYRQVKELGYLVGDEDADHFEMYLGRGRIKTPNFSPEDMERLRKELWRRVNFKSPDKLERAKKLLDPNYDGSVDHQIPVLALEGD